jgi:lysophospholipase L1-like esterase
MDKRPDAEAPEALRRRVRRMAAFALIVTVQFAIFEAALRVWGSSEAAPSFQGLFEGDPRIGHRLKPHANVRFRTSEFDTQIAINGTGVRDDEELRHKAADERRIVLVGDSLVLSVQVPFEQTFGELLEARLNAAGRERRYRVINAGVQGYGPVEELLLFRDLAPTLQPDLVIVALYAGNDAEEAVQSVQKLDGAPVGAASMVREGITIRLRRLVRRSMVLQVLRLRIVSATERFTPRIAPPEPPLQSYAAHPAPRIAEGIAITRRCVEGIVATAAALNARTAVALMPARFQVDDGDYAHLRDAVAQGGGELVRDAATERFDHALASVPIPRLDVLPPLRRARPGPDLFFQKTAHLTPRGHEIVAEALAQFIEVEGLLDGHPAGPNARTVPR